MGARGSGGGAHRVAVPPRAPAAHLWAHCGAGRMASGSVTLLRSGAGTWLWLSGRLAKRTSYSTQHSRKVLKVTTNRNCLGGGGHGAQMDGEGAQRQPPPCGGTYTSSKRSESIMQAKPFFWWKW